MALTATLGTTAEGTGTTASAPLTITDAANQTLVVGLLWDDPGPYNPTVTYNGDALTQLAETTGSGRYIWVGALANPDAGAEYTIAVSASPVFDNRAWRLIAVILEDSDQTTPLEGAQVYESNASTATSCTTTSATGDLVLSFGAINNKVNAACSPTGTGQTTIGTAANADGACYFCACYTAGAASVTTGYTMDVGPGYVSEIACNANAAGGSEPPITPFPAATRLMLLGIG